MQYAWPARTQTEPWGGTDTSPTDTIVTVAQIYRLETALNVENFQNIVPVTVLGPVAATICRFCCYLLQIESEQHNAWDVAQSDYSSCFGIYTLHASGLCFSD